jgi:integrase
MQERQHATWGELLREAVEKPGRMLEAYTAFAKILDPLRQPEGYIFAGEKKHFALHLDNLERREIKPKLGAAWHGWQAFRRGLATNLYDLGVPAKVAQGILRHSDVATTNKHYIVWENRGHGKTAMQALEKAIKKADKKHTGKTVPKNKNAK